MLSYGHNHDFSCTHNQCRPQVQEVAVHPMLSLIANSEQPLTTRYSRRLITMEKTRSYDTGLERLAFAAEGPFE